jgi:hypothetical protein
MVYESSWDVDDCKYRTWISREEIQERIEGDQGGRGWILEPDLIIRRSCGSTVRSVEQDNQKPKREC